MVYIQCNDTWNKGSGCRKICIIMSINFAKTLVWKRGNDVKLWRHKQRKPNTNDHHMILTQNSPMKIFCVRHCARALVKISMFYVRFLQAILQLSLSSVWPPLWLRFYIYTFLMCTNTGSIEAKCKTCAHIRRGSYPILGRLVDV